MKKTLGIILNNPSTELGPMTEYRNPITMPFYARYRLIDFALSNLVNSGIKKIGLVASDKYRSLLDHVGSGQEWGLSRKGQSLIILQGASRLNRSMNVNINMMDFYKNETVFKRNYADDILIVCPIVVCHINYQDALHYHQQSGNDITFISTPINDNVNPENDVFICCNEDMQVNGISFGKKANCNYQYSGMVIVSQQTILNFIRYSADSGEIDMLEIIEQNLSNLKVGNVEFDDYLRRVNTINEYFKINMELLDIDKCNCLFKADSKVYTKEKDNHPTRYMHNADVSTSCVASGGIIDGKVSDSILFRQVTIDQNANVSNCILYEGCKIGKDTVLDYVIADRNVTINDGVTLKGTIQKPIILSKHMEV